MTRYGLLLGLSGLSEAEAAEFHCVSLEAIKSWATGRRRPTEKAIREIQGLISKQERVAAAALRKYRSTVAEFGPADHVDASSTAASGWPKGARAMLTARVLAGLPASQRVTF